ncbi:MAG: short-chain dehydrogenase [Gammaproteobacteria bacterium]|nr:short-chain dehydrogenase [Gammaproteobacteria bacterium]|tara:strand:+ start:3493 stop:4206 length:714 start_codon:yes stop_codon:yes gene_type:complete
MAVTGNFSGKKALVFGGTSGIGLAVVHRLCEQGAEVVAISRDPSKAGDLAGVTLAACDVRDTDALAELLAAHAPIDLLISAATGGSRAAGPFLQMDLAAYQASFDKLWGYTNIVRLGTEYLSEKGAIVLVSGAPARRAKPGQAALASVGGAVEQFARAVAPELVPRRINVVSPGVIDTPMFGPDAAAREKMLGAATAKNLIPRAGTPDEVAEAVMFVAGNEFVTGTTVEVDGGWILS